MCLRFIHIHVVAYICASFFFYRWLIFHCRNRLPFSIYSSADGYLSCFHILAVMNIALLWTFMHECLCEQMFSVFLGVYLGVGLLGHMVTLTFEELSDCLKRLHHFPFLTLRFDTSALITSILVDGGLSVLDLIAFPWWMTGASSIVSWARGLGVSSFTFFAHF